MTRRVTIQIIRTYKASAVFHVTHIKHRTLIPVSEEKGGRQGKPYKLVGQITGMYSVEKDILLQTRGRSVKTSDIDIHTHTHNAYICTLHIYTLHTYMYIHSSHTSIYSQHSIHIYAYSTEPIHTHTQKYYITCTIYTTQADI